MNNQAELPPDTAAEDILKHLLCGALTHLDAIGKEIKRLNIKEDPKDNNPKDYERARILHLTMLAINDIIHPAHKLLPIIFKDNEDYFNSLVRSFSKAKKDGLTFGGCMCDTCVAKGS
jgi:hypothetical protein